MTGQGRAPKESAGRAVPAGIAREMRAEGGRLTFARFMDLALTHPIDGYYSRTTRPLGLRGHFTTAPCLSPEFNGAVSRLLTELVTAMTAPASEGTRPLVVELGAGRGETARAVLRRWEEESPALRDRVAYVMVDINRSLRAAQRRAVMGPMDRGWQVRWADSLDEALAVTAVAAPPGVDAPVAPALGSGDRPLIVVGNEFVDALPVHLVDVRGDEPLELWVELDDSTSAGVGYCAHEAWAQLSTEAEKGLLALFERADPSDLRRSSSDGIIEVRPAVRGLIERVAAAGPAGCLLTIDYGEWRSRCTDDPCAAGAAVDEVTRPHHRTVRGYFRHQLVNDPLVRVGAQDLTADVDFAALDHYGRQVGFETVVFTTVAALLRGDGGEARLAALRHTASRSLEADRRAAVLEGLLDEEGLGGAFKVMLQARG
jgi:SAM-dependent MidA family methyltransferase